MEDMPKVEICVSVSGKELIHAVKKLILGGNVIDGKKWDIQDANILTRAGAAIKIAVEEEICKGK